MELKKRITPEVETLLNERIKNEYISAMIYEVMSNWCDCYGFYKAKDKYRKYHDEELTHARRLTDYVIDRNGIVKTGVIPEQPSEYKSLLDVVVKSYEHEITITDAYNKLSKQVLTTGDMVTLTELNWFTHEQIEEESKFADAIILANRLGLTDTSVGIEWFKLEDFISS